MNAPQTYSYWETKEWLQPPDLLIVGGGIVGASTALFYKEKYPDHNVKILDKGMMPEGASTRNAGFACIGSISEHLADMKTAGEQVVFGRIKRRWEGLNLLKETMGEEAIDYEHTGGHEIFTDNKIFDACCARIPEINRKLQEQMGLEPVYSATEYEGYPAILNRVEGAINSGRLMKRLHQKLSALGVETMWNCAVKSIRGNRVVLENGMEFESSKTVLATNGFIRNLTDIQVQPARGYVFVTKPMENLKWCGTFHFDEGYIYFRNVENRLLIGGARNIAKAEEETDQFGVNPAIKDHLVRFVSDTLKLPAGWEINQEWSGIMGMTGNKEPIIKEVSPNVWVAAGLSGMGIAIGMEVAKGVVKRIG
ncbi:FAD-binding oxidoreductase [Rhodohalobacter sp. SW132]|uniref:NAD(P)/FAD-dependent oxidoreductase n=1 Tax=Rhodohalobacter sp. SW132 TaxID=2293433 RepID=UPI000E27633E|nr:FAD-dependent oxidoreductase [Rhodohalobacter sp. SW132]REL33097.1 FAD-binding oxidoreductase [Rhodohalobacter sp. SW132]